MDEHTAEAAEHLIEASRLLRVEQDRIRAAALVIPDDAEPESLRSVVRMLVQMSVQQVEISTALTRAVSELVQLEADRQRDAET